MSSRVLFFSAGFGIAGLYLTLRFSVQWAGALCRKYRRGVPYLYGSSGRSFLLLVLSAVLLLAGVLLGGAGWGLHPYQPVYEAVRVGAIRVRAGGGNDLSFTFEPDADYPSPLRVAEQGIPSGRWSVAGRFVLWHRSMKWLGLRDSHRLSWVLSAPGPTGIPRWEEVSRVPLIPGNRDRFWNLLHAYDGYNPLVETREFQAPWKSGPATRLDLYAFPGGYLYLKKDASEDSPDPP